MYERRKVLIADDDEDARAFVEAILHTTGWDTLAAENGQEAVDIANQEIPDLIILDVTMPVMDGFEAFKELRQSPFTENIPVIMLTAVNARSGGTTHSAESVQANLGVSAPNGFVDKPVDPDYLLYVIGGILG